MAEERRAEGARPLTEPVPTPDLSDPFERGVYLIEIADCSGCHTAWEGNPNPGIFGGGNAVERAGGVAFGANLTADPSALGGWTPEIFRARIRNGRGGTLQPTMPWIAYGKMTDQDLDAIFLALQSTPPVRHWVSNSEPPTACVVCGQSHGLGATNVPTLFERVTADLGPLDAYAGSYLLRAWTITITAREGALFASEDGGPPIELIPVAGSRFQGRGLSAPISFERDASGAIAALLTHELGATRWKRVP